MRPFGAIFRLLNVRHTVGRPIRTLLTIAGVGAGVALVVATFVINSTLRASINANARGLGGNAQLEVSASSTTGLSEQQVSRVGKTLGVRRAIPVVRTSSKLSTSHGAIPAAVIGVPRHFGELFDEDLGPLGTWLSKRQQPGVWLSRELAEQLGLHRSEAVRIETPLGLRSLPVAGVIDTVPFQAVNNGVFAVLALQPAQSLFEKQGHVGLLYVIDDGRRSDLELSRDIKHAIGSGVVIGPPGTSAQTYQRTFDSIVQLTSLASVAALMVALFVVVNAISMSLLEQRRTLATTLALGARRQSVILSVVAEGTALGALGCLVGTGGGLVLARALVGVAIKRYPLLPLSAGGGIHVTAAPIILGITLGVGVSCLGAFLPARRLTGVSPLDSVRPAPSVSYERELRSDIGWQLGSRVGTIAVLTGLAAAAIYSRVGSQTWLAGISVALVLGGIMLLLPLVVPSMTGLLGRICGRLLGVTGRVGIRNLAQQQGRTTITVGALGLTAGMVIGVTTALGSFHNHVEQLAQHWYGAPLYVESNSTSSVTAEQPPPASLQDELDRVEGVGGAFPIRDAMLDWGGQQLEIYAIPVAEAAEQGFERLSSQPGVSQPTFVHQLSHGEVVISRYTSRQRHIGTGDAITLPTPGGMRKFRVAGVFDDVVSFDSMFMDYAVYARIWRDPAADMFAVYPRPGFKVGAVKDYLEQIIKGLGVPAEVDTRQGTIDRLLRVVDGTFSLASALQFAALLVALLVVANTMLTAIVERRWEFSLIRGIGMTPAHLRRLVLAEAAGIGILGSAVALLVGSVLGGFMVLAARSSQTA